MKKPKFEMLGELAVVEYMYQTPDDVRRVTMRFNQDGPRLAIEDGRQVILAPKRGKV